MVTSESSAPDRLLTVITYGTSCPRLTWSRGVDLEMPTEPRTCGSTGMWLLKIWLVPGDWLSSSIRWTWWIVPAVRGGTEGAGASSEGCTSQNRAVLGMTSPPLLGQAGTENGAVKGSDMGGMIWEYPGAKVVPPGTVTPMT